MILCHGMNKIDALDKVKCIKVNRMAHLFFEVSPVKCEIGSPVRLSLILTSLRTFKILSLLLRIALASSSHCK